MKKQLDLIFMKQLLLEVIVQGRHHVNFFGTGYVNLGPFILDNIRTLVKALQT